MFGFFPLNEESVAFDASSNSLRAVSVVLDVSASCSCSHADGKRSQLMQHPILVVVRISSPNLLSFIKQRKLDHHHFGQLSKFSSSSKSNQTRVRMIKAPAAERNKQPILDVLFKLYPAYAKAEVLEIASGTGQHVIHFANHFRSMSFTPTDYDASSIETINKNVIIASKADNIRPAQVVDVSLPVSRWPTPVTDRTYDLMICTNMIHISPWKCTQGLFAAASHLLNPNGRLMTYGPYAVDGILAPESNVQFDQYLKSQNPEWGVRDTADIKIEAERNGFLMSQMVDMPANNKILMFERKQN